MTTKLLNDLAKCAVRRAHLYAYSPRFWRECAAASILYGFSWPKAELRGIEE